MAFRTNKVPVLQDKSASGAVATFNTALAMPLASCNIAVNAWQEGSGEPSPVNERPIHGFSEVNVTRCGVNLWDEEWETGVFNTTTGANQPTTANIRSKNYIAIKGNVTYRILISVWVMFFDKNKNVITTYNPSGVERYNNSYYYTKNIIITPPPEAHYMRFYTLNVYGGTYKNDISINYPSTDTDYHAYTGNIYTIQLGQEVYGAEVDVVNGVMRVTYGLVDLGSLSWQYFSNTNPPHFASNLPEMKTKTNNILCSLFKVATSHYENANLTIRTSDEHSLHGIKASWTDYTVTSDFKNAVRGSQLLFELAEPFDIQLTPTQIETLIGNNTIFADTGDVDLTYKDLDIAKRGSFREVFKLPS